MKANFGASLVMFFCLVLAVSTASAQSKSTTAKDASQFHSLKELMDLVPKQSLLQLKVPVKAEAARMSANEIFSQKAQNMRATLKVRVESWQPWQYEGNPNKFSVTVPWQTVTFNSVAMGVQVWITLPPESQSGLAGLQKGRDATFTGNLSRVQITNNSNEGLVLHVEMMDAKVEGR